MWDRIKQLWQKNTEKQPLLLSEAEQFALLDQANQALQQGQYAQAQQHARQLVDSPVEAIANDGMRVLGLVHFHQQQYAEAWPVFEKLASRTGAASDWFNVVTSATLAGELQRGDAAFEHAIKAHDASPDSPGLSAASMRHYYACALRDRGEHARAFEHVQVLRTLYEKLPQTDARLLDLRGFPRLDAVLEMMADVLAHSGDIPEAEEWLRDFGRHLKADAQNDIQGAIERLRRLAPKSEQPAQAPHADDAGADAPAEPGSAPTRPPANRQDTDPRLD